MHSQAEYRRQRPETHETRFNSRSERRKTQRIKDTARFHLCLKSTLERLRLVIIAGVQTMAFRARKAFKQRSMQCACGFKKGKGDLADEQSIDEFLADPHRNRVYPPRSVIYLINFEHALLPIHMDMVSEWVSAFYHPLSVKIVDVSLAKVGRGVVAGTAVGDFKIRSRKCADNVFQRQLSINDLIDAVIGCLPVCARRLGRVLRLWNHRLGHV
jgi:hypothetical protein